MVKTEVLGRDLKMALMKVTEVGEAGVAGVVVVGAKKEKDGKRERKKDGKKTIGHVESRAAGATSNGRGKGWLPIG
ncbi:uncharacterized protein ARB_02688 [Trichophyton benhamiae CBS 112371]|uniref:Uncharacterized protein n=1 Tax=Arthroderma benhamiae (strain ATCC MYA-4681 / CBS 112371) TaxID=663331 RepID=D4B2G0_ARTBC|nr:uncharacterized protein ARB_02688 [Trichophyton benhamiae CBS 112371]EFE30526.1 hypothetical protein ARB_02688 [Trichophyton benhamiae CBS 112371]